MLLLKTTTVIGTNLWETLLIELHFNQEEVEYLEVESVILRDLSLHQLKMQE